MTLTTSTDHNDRPAAAGVGESNVIEEMNDMTNNESAHRLRELDQRTNAGMRITLAWDPADDRVLLTVDDLVTGEYLEVETHPGSARYAYEHPFAYLASVPNASTGYCPVAA